MYSCTQSPATWCDALSSYLLAFSRNTCALVLPEFSVPRPRSSLVHHCTCDLPAAHETFYLIFTTRMAALHTSPQRHRRTVGLLESAILVAPRGVWEGRGWNCGGPTNNHASKVADARQRGGGAGRWWRLVDRSSVRTCPEILKALNTCSRRQQVALARGAQGALSVGGRGLPQGFIDEARGIV